MSDVMPRRRALHFLIPLAWLCSGCTPEPGSEGWCELMNEKPASEWNFKEAAEYARSCVVTLPGKVGSEAWCKELRAKPPGDWSANDARNFAEQCLLR